MKKILLVASIGIVIVFQCPKLLYSQELQRQDETNSRKELIDKIPLEQNDFWELFAPIAGAMIAATSALLLPVSKSISKRAVSNSSSVDSQQITDIAKIVQAESEREKNIIIRNFVQN